MVAWLVQQPRAAQDISMIETPKMGEIIEAIKVRMEKALASTTVVES